MTEAEFRDAIWEQVKDTEVQGLPLPRWASHLKGVLIPPDLAERHPGAPEFALAEYLHGRGSA